ncbi:MAG: hypothetical protein RIR95_50 [Pseudomonadota bacterium]
MAKDTRSVIATAAKQGLGAEVEMLPVQADETVRKLDQLIKLMDDQVHLQRVGLLQDGHILRFNSSTGQRIALSLPDAIDDYVQRVILRTRNFYEAKLLATLQSLSIVTGASTVCDVGANIGNHSVFFGKILGAGRVLAFEPQTHCYETLRENLALNGLDDQSTAYNCMLGAVSGNGALSKFNARNLGGTSFVATEAGDVPMFALDDVLTTDVLQSLDLIKIDVEGMQMDVLLGAQGILEHRKPALWIELLAQTSAFDPAMKFLAQFGYLPTRIGPNDVIFRA